MDFRTFLDIFGAWFGKVDWKGLYIEIRNVGITVNFFFITAFIYSLIRAYQVRPKLIPLRKLKRRTITLKSQSLKDAWIKISERAKLQDVQTLVLCIIEADSLADEALRRLGLRGDHMADRLEKLSPLEVRSLNRLWQAHRVRNDLVHSPGFQVTEAEANETLRSYEDFLREIGAI